MDVDPQLGSELSPRERRHARTQQAILNAARAIIHEQGLDKLSMRAIADQIDYSPASLYEYYGGKEEIILAVCEQGHRKLKRYLAAVDTSRATPDYTVEIGMAYIRFALQNPDYFLLMFTQIQAGHELPEDRRQFPPPTMLGDASSFPILLQAVQRGLDEGTIDAEAAGGQIEIAYALWAIVHGIAMLRITHLRDLPFPTDDIDRQTLTRFVRSLGS